MAIPKNARHSPDFTTVSWNGMQYTFTRMQAAIVEILWKAAAHGTPEMHATAILEQVDSRMKESRIGPLFFRNPAWKTLIVRGQRRGSYRLNAEANV